jgi:8-oxo-dGTP diphosphatase
VLHDFLSRIWTLLGAPLRRGVVWLFEAKFTLGVSGVITDENGRVLLLKHRYWKDQAWGLPSGCVKRGEQIAVALAREVKEETGLEVEVTDLLEVRTSARTRVEFTFRAKRCNGSASVCSPEILEARFFALTALPKGLLPSHRQIIAVALQASSSSN